jgi:hypothetical protein
MIRTKEELKSVFETGDRPTGQDFADLIDATYSYIDWTSPISVTGAVTATIGKHHVCSGTTADYTVTLPSVNGNAGKLISFEMAGDLTKLVTIAASGTEVIDGATTRIMWAGETAILLCDGVHWTKIGGKSIPMISCHILLTPGTETTAQSIASSTYTKVSLNTIVSSSPMSNTANKSLITVKRSSSYEFRLAVGYPSIGPATFTALLYKNSAYFDSMDFAGSSKDSNMGSVVLPASQHTVGTVFELYTIHYASGSKYLYGYSSSFNCLQVKEIPTW